MPIKLRPRGVTVAGTTVRVEIVETDDDEEVESAGEYERGDVGCELDAEGDDDEEGSDGGLDCLRSLLNALLRFWKQPAKVILLKRKVEQYVSTGRRQLAFVLLCIVPLPYLWENM